MTGSQLKQILFPEKHKGNYTIASFAAYLKTDRRIVDSRFKAAKVKPEFLKKCKEKSKRQ